MKIYKYPIKITDLQSVAMPEGSKIISVGNQSETVVLWAEVCPNNAPSKKWIRMYGTGNEMSAELQTFIGTVQMSNGLVWHVYLSNEI